MGLGGNYGTLPVISISFFKLIFDTSKIQWFCLLAIIIALTYTSVRTEND